MKTIEENNKLIAEFMGWKVQTDPTERFFGEWYDNCGLKRTQKNLKVLLYHNSWDWLMEVVKKIDNIIITSPINSSEREDIADDLFSSLRQANINYSYSQVVEFINEYNKYQ